MKQYLSNHSPSSFVFLFLSLSPNVASSVETLDEATETESVMSFRRERPRRRESLEQHGQNNLYVFEYIHIRKRIKQSQAVGCYVKINLNRVISFCNNRTLATKTVITKTVKYNPPNIYTIVNGNIVWILINYIHCVFRAFIRAT